MNYRCTLIRIRKTARSSRTGTTACLAGDHKWQPQSNTGTYCPQHAQCRSPSARGVDCFEASRRFHLRIRASVDLKPHSNEMIHTCCFLRNREKTGSSLAKQLEHNWKFSFRKIRYCDKSRIVSSYFLKYSSLLIFFIFFFNINYITCILEK